MTEAIAARIHLHSIPADAPAEPCRSVAAQPHLSLSPFVVGYCGYLSSRGVHHRELPVNLVALVIELSGPSRVVTGPRTVAAVDGENTWRHGVSIGLTPAGSLALLGVPMPELVNGSARLADVLGARHEAELAERLAAAPDWATRFALLDDQFRRRLAPRRPQPDPLVLHAWARLQQPAGRLRVADLASELAVSRRYLEKGFGRHIGVSPKTVARITRFQRCVHLLAQQASLQRIAAECGFADQAHFQREMRAMTGLTPAGLYAFLQYSRSSPA